jgi:UDP-GlcNAc:undecaprenyl-phosphate GlcNAc-1-phosphate transferase
MLPGVDMLRLFIYRLLKKQNPFSSDLSHFHHYLFKEYKIKIALLIYFSLMIGPLIIYNFVQIHSLYIIAAFIIIYSTLIYYLIKKNL